MTYLGYDNWLELWEASGTEHENLMKRYMSDGIDQLIQGDSSITKMFKQSEDVSSQVVEWMEEWAYPHKITCTLSGASGTGATATFSGKIFGASVSEALLKKVIRLGTVLENPSTRLQYKVSALNLGSSEATVAVHGSSDNAANDSTALVYTIVGEPFKDTTDLAQPRSIEPYRRYVGTQIFSEEFTITQTRENTAYYNISSESERNFAALMKKMQQELSYSLLRMKPTMSAGSVVWGTGTEDPTMRGLCTYPALCYSEVANTQTYKDLSSGQLTKYELDATIRSQLVDEFVNFNVGKWIIACHPLVHRVISTFDSSHRRQEYHDKTVGMGQADTFASDIGYNFPIHSDIYFPEKALMIVRTDKCEWGYYKNDHPHRGEVATASDRYRAWQLSFQTYGLRMRNPRQHQAYIFNIDDGT